MSDKNFMSYGDAETILSGYSTAIKQKAGEYTEIAYEDWLELSPEQQATGKWYVTGVPEYEGFTVADKCMLSDGETSVEDAIEALNGDLNYKTPRINLSAITSTSVKDFLTKMCQQIQGLTLTNYVIYTSMVERVNVDYFTVMFFRTSSKTVVFLAIPAASTELYTGQLALNGTISAYRYGGTAI